jgi:hypothetical protein
LNLKIVGPQLASTAGPVLAGDVESWRGAANKKQQLLWKNKFIGTQIFFPVEGWQ